MFRESERPLSMPVRERQPTPGHCRSQVRGGVVADVDRYLTRLSSTGRFPMRKAVSQKLKNTRNVRESYYVPVPSRHPTPAGRKTRCNLKQHPSAFQRRRDLRRLRLRYLAARRRDLPRLRRRRRTTSRRSRSRSTRYRRSSATTRRCSGSPSIAVSPDVVGADELEIDRLDRLIPFRRPRCTPCTQ